MRETDDLRTEAREEELEIQLAILGVAGRLLATGNYGMDSAQAARDAIELWETLLTVWEGPPEETAQ
jgi:hypothetical protein